MFKYRETENQEAMLRAALELVENDVVILMADERGQFTGRNDEEGIEIRLRRYKSGEYKLGLYTPEGHTWVTCPGSSKLWELWDALFDEAFRQREQILAPRFEKLLKRTLQTGSAKR